MRKNLFAAVVIFFTAAVPVFSQSLSVNTDGSTADASAMLDVKSNAKGILIPRMTRTERNAVVSPATGLLIFQSGPDSIGFYYYNGTAWTWILANSNTDSLAWRTGGNTGTTTNNFVGTTDNVPLILKSNNSEKLRITPNGEVGIGTATPNSTYGYAKLEVASEGFGVPTDLLVRNAVSSAGYAPGLVFQHARGTLAAPLTVNNGDYLGAFSTMNYDGSNYILSAGLDIYADGAVSTNIVPTKLQFNTMNSLGSNGARVTIKNDGKVGIGTSNPLARTHISGGNFLVEGALGTDSILGFSGGATRMFFYPRKAAFRAGAVFANQWDDANIGNYSVGMGSNASAKTDYSISIGEGNIAETSLFAVAIGRENHSSGFASLAMGHFSEATGDYSSSIGLRDTVSGYGASSMGSYNKVSAAYGFTSGFSNVVTGLSSMATGNNNYAPSFGETTIGNFATQYTALNASGVNTADRVFTIGNGTGTGTRADALVVLKNGRIGIGIADPSTLFTNNNSNTVGVDGFGLNSPSLNWAMGSQGYVAGIYNSSAAANRNGLVVKIAGTASSNRILDLSTSASQTSAGTPVLVANGNGTVGVGTSSPNSTLHVDGTIAIGVSLNLAGGTSGSPISLLNQKSYLGLSPADNTNNYYQLPDPALYPGRMYIIRNNSDTYNANLTTAAGLLYPGGSSTPVSPYTLNPTGGNKTVMAVSDGASWTIMVQN